MRVLLKSDFFGPDAHLYVRDPNGRPIEIPDALREGLPRGAKIIEDSAVVDPAPVAVEQATLRDFDELRAAADAEETFAKRAEANRMAGRGKPVRS